MPASRSSTTGRHAEAGAVRDGVLRHRSCGKCTPCRIGSTRGVETADKLRRHRAGEEQIALLADLCNTMKFGSLCALGGFTPYPVMSAINHFPEDFRPSPIAEAAE
jgi:formate dehydrogenase iron-sulfur subunit